MRNIVLVLMLFASSLAFGQTDFVRDAKVKKADNGTTLNGTTVELGKATSGAGLGEFASDRFQYLNGFDYSIGGSLNDAVSQPLLHLEDDGDIGLSVKKGTSVGNGLVFDKAKGALIGGIYRVGNNNAAGNSSFSWGINARASGTNSVAFATGLASGNNSVAFGNSDAIGGNSFTYGNLNTSNGSGSFSGGSSSTATGTNAYAFGTSSVANGTNATASGNMVKALGSFTVVFGSENTSSALGAVVSGGTNNVASGIRSAVIGGSENISSFDNSTSGGIDNIADSYAQTALGQYSVETTSSAFTYSYDDVLFKLGNGTDSLERHNAITVLKKGWTGIYSKTDQLAVQTEAEATPRALLDVKTTHGGGGASGVILADMTQAQRDAISVSNLIDGLMIYNTTTNRYESYDASVPEWVSMSGGGAAITTKTIAFNEVVGNDEIITLAQDEVFFFPDVDITITSVSYGFETAPTDALNVSLDTGTSNFAATISAGDQYEKVTGSVIVTEGTPVRFVSSAPTSGSWEGMHITITYTEN